jgi:acetolactate synthase I/II/III large subunit
MHATMAVYNAWADRVPVILMGGNDLDAASRPPGVPTYHSAQDINALVRDFTKWDDNPVSLQHFAQSMVRAYKMAMTPPYEPVMIALDGGLQEKPMDDHTGGLYIPRYVKAAPPQAEVAALRETAKLLVNAEHPVIVVDRTTRTQNGISLLVELTELIQAPVIDQSNRMNFPNTHHLCQSTQAQALIRDADVILGLEVSDFWNTVNLFIDNAQDHGHGTRQSRVKPGTKLITISSVELNQKSNYQDFQRFQSVDIGMAGDAEASLPSLIEAVKSAIVSDRKGSYEKRGEAMKRAWRQAIERSRQAAAVGWDASPISLPRLCAEIWAQIKDLDYSLVSSRPGIGTWPNRLWKMDRHHQWLGGSGGGGLGYGLPASVGAAHANKPLGRFSVALLGDGDAMYAPGAMWTAARHKIPFLGVLHNNKGYHQEVMHLQRMSNRRNRVANLGTEIKDLGPVGTRIENPDIDYSKIASGMGWWTSGPVSDPNELGGVLKKAVAVVKSGQPALVDVISQPR